MIVPIEKTQVGRNALNMLFVENIVRYFNICGKNKTKCARKQKMYKL